VSTKHSIICLFVARVLNVTQLGYLEMFV